MRVAYVQGCESLGGAERQASLAIARLPPWGIDVVPLVGPNPLVCRWLDEQDVRGTILSRDFPPGWPHAQGVERLALPGRYLSAARKVGDQIESIISEGAIDLVALVVDVVQVEH